MSENEVWCKMLDIRYERIKAIKVEYMCVKPVKKSWCQAALGPIE